MLSAPLFLCLTFDVTMNPPQETAQISEAARLVEQITLGALNRWLNQLETPADPWQTGPLDITNRAQRERLSRLLQLAADFPGTHQPAAELALALDSTMRAGAFYAEWLPVIDKLAAALLPDETIDPLIVANLWRSVGHCRLRLGQEEAAVQAFETAQYLTDYQPGEFGRDLSIDTRVDIAGARVRLMKFEEAEEVAFQILADASVVGDLFTEADGRELLAYTCLKGRERLHRAFEQAQQALLLWWRLGDPAGQARALHYMGEACRLSHRTRPARLYLERARDSLAGTGHRAALADLNYALGSLEIVEGRYEEAVSYITPAKAFFEEKGDAYQITICAHGLGIALTHLERYKEAEDALQVALRGWQRLGNRQELAQVWYALADLFRRRGWKREAERAYRKALQTAHTLSPGDYRENLIRELEEELEKLLK